MNLLLYDKGPLLNKKTSSLLQQYILAVFIATLFIAKVKVEILHSHITKQLLTSISADIRIYQLSKVIFTAAFGFFRVDKFLCQPH